MTVIKSGPWAEAEAEAFFSAVFFGKHHIPGKLRQDSPTCWSVGSVQPMSTFDYDMLTRLVFLAHEWAVRVEIRPSGPGRLRISASKRLPLNDVAIYYRHPTLDQAVEKFKERDGQQWVKWVERSAKAEVTS